jgi:large subunit ribosomal protein L4
MQKDVVTLGNDKAGTIDLADGVFGVPVRKDIISRMVYWQLAKRQAGTHMTKTIEGISGTTAKPYKQKGTGRARQGSLRSPQFRGGATVFGPVSRDHGHKLTKKVRKLALRSALSSKLADGKLIVLDEAKLDNPKTSELVRRLGTLGVSSALFIDGSELDANFVRAASNIPGIDVLPQQGANVYDILRRDVLVLTKAAVKHLEERLA